EWIALVEADGPASEQERALWLKSEHGLGANDAGWIAYSAQGSGPDYSDPQALVDAMYTSAKSILRPIHDELVHLALALGPDVTVPPCATIVPLRRRHV